MSAVAAVARNTFREAVRDRVLFLVVGFGVVVLAGSRVLSPIALGEAPRITVDLGLSALGLLGFVIVALVGTNLVHKEIEKRTIQVVLSRPLSRPAYLVGKWLGLALTMAAAAVGMAAVLVPLACALRGAAILGPVCQAVFLVLCANAVLAALTVLFSALSTPLLSTVYTLSIYALGHWAGDLREFAERVPGIGGRVLEGFAYLVPHLELFNLRSHVAYGQEADALRMGIALAYAAVYVTAALALAVVAFERRELK